MNRKILVLGAIVIGALLIFQLLASKSSPAESNYSQLIEQVEKGKVQKVQLEPSDNQVQVYLRGSDGEEADYKTGYPNNLEDQLIRSFQSNNVDIAVEDTASPFLVSALGWLIPLLLLLALFFLIVGAGSGGGLRQLSQFSKSKARRINPEEIPITFADVAGCEEAIEEMQEMKDFLQDPTRFQALGARIPKGVLLAGSPGTGKTMIAKALAREAGVAFFSMAGSEAVEALTGIGASRVRSLFEEARAEGTAVIFLDEIDAIGRQRGTGFGGGNDEKEGTLNQLLVEMDGFHSEANVVVVAATNRPDVLDPALLRPGRFDRQIIMDQPDRPGRKAILEVHARSKPLAESVDLNAIAGGTVGFVGADLENLLNEAALFAARRKSQEIEQKDIDDALLRVVAGPEKRARILPPHERKITAYHELGHAIVGHILEHCDPIERISIVSRGSALGFTLSLPQEEKFLISRNRLRDEMAMSLGGRAAEEIIFEDITTGASGDLERVTAVARQMIMRYAMGDKLGQRIFGHNHAQPFLGREFQSEPDYSDATAGQIDSEIKILVDEAYQRALTLVAKNRGLLDSMAEILLERETLTRPEFEALFKGEKFVHVESPILTEEALSKETIQPIIASPLAESLKDIAAGRRAVVVMSDGRVLSANGVQLGILENPDSLWSQDFAELDINVVNEHEVVVRLRVSAKRGEIE